MTRSLAVIINFLIYPGYLKISSYILRAAVNFSMKNKDSYESEDGSATSSTAGIMDQHNEEQVFEADNHHDRGT
jgi:hypothetical protein